MSRKYVDFSVKHLLPPLPSSRPKPLKRKEVKKYISKFRRKKKKGFTTGEYLPCTLVTASRLVLEPATNQQPLWRWFMYWCRAVLFNVKLFDNNSTTYFSSVLATGPFYSAHWLFSQFQLLVEFSWCCNWYSFKVLVARDDTDRRFSWTHSPE